MKKININNLDINNCKLHFTNKNNLESIEKNGLLPKIGSNSFMLEKKAKIYFSKSAVGALEIANIWLRWLIFKKQKDNYLKKYNNLNLFYKDFISAKIYTPKIKEEVFKEFMDYMENNIYLVLDLTEGEDYKENDIDEVKQTLSKRPEFLRAMYGKIAENEKNPYCLERWNMQTVADRIITPDKIKILNSENDSALTILQDLYNKNNNKETDLQLLDEFIKFVQNKKIVSSL